MAIIKNEKLFEILGWVLLAALILCSGLFMSDAWKKYHSKVCMLFL